MYIVLFPDGRASGDAFAIFPSEKEVEKAMLKDRSNLGSRYVEIYKSSLKEFQMVSSCHHRQKVIWFMELWPHIKALI